MKPRAWLGANAVMLLAALPAAQAPTPKPKPKRPDLEVSLMIDGGMTEPPHLFILKVNFSGEVEGGGDLNPGLPPPPRRLSAAAHAELAALLRRERFFTMPRGIGSCPPDLGHRSIQAWQGTKLHSVTFCLEGGGVPIREAQSVLRVWYGVMSVVSSGKRVPPTRTDSELLSKKP
jgi:hypothetical protein